MRWVLIEAASRYRLAFVGGIAFSLFYFIMRCKFRNFAGWRNSFAWRGLQLVLERD
jgi:hypothetical protein